MRSDAVKQKVAAVVVPKVKEVTQPIRETTGFGGPPPGNVSVRKIGDKAFAGPSGANGYKSASATPANVYKHYNVGNYIGTYLGTEGIFTKLIVEETGFLWNSNVTVWVPTADLKY